jgi:apolipoprotein N-acyltransferase
MPTSDSALVIQPNLDPGVQWTSLLQDRTEQQLSLLSNALPARLVIWPELPAPLYYYDDPEFHRAATQIAQRHGYFLFGTVAYNSQHQPMNSAVLLGPNGMEAGRYDKIDLVPFGEFVPPMFSFVNRITQEAGDFVPGHDIRVLPAAGHRVGVFICYESAFPDLVRQFSREGADVLVNLSNDGYFGRSEARQQHLLLVRMRAVENRRFIVRSTNDGISAVIDPSGRILRELPPYQEVAAPVRYGVVESTTFYARHGDWFAWSCLAIGVTLAVLNLRVWRKP